MLYSFTYLTIDGVMADPHLWHPRFESDESTNVLVEMLAASHAMLLGRRTYAEFASWWPEQGESTPLARLVNGIDKHVVSSTLMQVTWHGASLLSGPVVESAAGLRDSLGPIMVAGSATLATTLLGAGLLDEVRLFVDPHVRGNGLRIFDGSGPVAFSLVEQRAMPKGVQYVVLRPEGPVSDA